MRASSILLVLWLLTPVMGQELVDPRLLYFGQPDLLSIDDILSPRFDALLAETESGPNTQVLSGVLGPTTVGRAGTGLVLGRAPLRPNLLIWKGEHGTPIVVMREWCGETVAHRFANPLGQIASFAVPDVTGDGWPEVCSFKNAYLGRLPEWIDPFWHESWSRPFVGPEGMIVSVLDVARGEAVWTRRLDEPGDVSWMTNPVKLADLDGDALADFLVGVGRLGSDEVVFEAFSSVDGETIRRWQLLWPEAPERVAWSWPSPNLGVVDPGYVEADGVRRALVWLGHEAQGFVEIPLADGEGAAGWKQVRAEDHGVRWLGTPRSLGDVDGNGSLDVLVTGYGPFRGRCNPGAKLEAIDLGAEVPGDRRPHGAVLVLDSRTGEELHSFVARRCEERISPRPIPYEDLDGDGLVEVLVAAHQGGRRQLMLVDLATGMVRGRWPKEGWANILRPQGLVPDQDGDGHPEVLVAAGAGAAFDWDEVGSNALSGGLLCISSRALVR